MRTHVRAIATAVRHNGRVGTTGFGGALPVVDALAFDGSSAPSLAPAGRLGRLALALAMLAAGMLFAAGLGASSASAVSCPNEVFLTGPSAKLPDCRAYELVSPRYTGGIPPTLAPGLGTNDENLFTMEAVNPTGDDVLFNTQAGALSGTPGTGVSDRYKARRTAEGWTTEYIGVPGSEANIAYPGGISPSHDYMFTGASEPTAALWAPWAGLSHVNMLRLTDGSFEPIARGSLGDDPNGEGRYLTDNATHIYFESAAHLEPLAGPAGKEAIYDRTVGGPTKVVSVLPGNQQASESAQWVGATKDGSEAVFELSEGCSECSGSGDFFIHRGEETEEAVRLNGAPVGDRLECAGSTSPETATLEYQWLRNGVAIPGATNSSYDVVAADEGSVLQCQTTASEGERKSSQTSAARLVEPYHGKNPPLGDAEFGGGSNPANVTGSTTVGSELTCSGTFTGGSATKSYQWLRDGVAISGATSAGYTTVGADEGHTLQCRVLASNADGASVIYSLPLPITPVYPQTSEEPSIANVTDPGNAPEVGDELSCATGTWSDTPSFAYQWLRDGSEIGGATSSTYTVAAADEGKDLQCEVTAENSAGTTKAVSGELVAEPQPASAPPHLTSQTRTSGAAVVGSTLYCEEGNWNSDEYPEFARQWLRNGVPIGGATEYSYTVTAADVGKVIQCRVTASNAGGETVALNAGAQAKYATVGAPSASASLPNLGLAFGGIFNGHLFYTDRPSRRWEGQYVQRPASLFSYDTATHRSQVIANTGDASFINVSEGGSHVYFVRTLQEGGEAQGKLYVWDRSSGTAKLITDLSGEDVTSGGRGHASLTNWIYAVGRLSLVEMGQGGNHTRSTPDGNVLLFEAQTQLTSFDNTEAAQEDCGNPEVEEEPCDEVYRYDDTTEELICVSCGEGTGPATGEGNLEISGYGSQNNVIEGFSPPHNISTDGSTAVFESTEALVPRDVNNARDVYRWSAGHPTALISTGQNLAPSFLYAVDPDASNIFFVTREQLLPQDENNATQRIYDARVNGGFPPPESTATEPCSGDVCQGSPTASPQPPRVPSESLIGSGNVKEKLRCRKGSHRVVRHGKERCVKRRHRHHRKHRKHRSRNGGKRVGK